MPDAQRPTGLVLWDIDGTLICHSTVGPLLYDQAVAEVTGRVSATPGDLRGSTDPEIVANKLTSVGVDPDRFLVSQILCRLEELLRRAASNGEWSARLLPGVAEILSAVNDRKSVVSSVLTGSTRDNAMTKLRFGGLLRWLNLSVGAFGSDDADRNALIPVVLQRFAECFGLEADLPAMVIVGDTPADLSCARAGGAQCLLVATGRFTPPELDNLGALAVLPDLTDTQTVLCLLDEALSVAD